MLNWVGDLKRSLQFTTKFYLLSYQRQQQQYLKLTTSLSQL
jgi:hypothetical protein